MTTNRFSPRFAPLRYDPSRAFVPFSAVSRTELIALNKRLETARRELLSDAESSDPGLFAFIVRPDRLLADYQKSRGRSELGRILAVGKRLRDTSDRLIVLDGGGDLLGARAMFAAGCHPYHNELSRGDRGGRPRVYFVENHCDNDAAQGLLDLLCHSRPATSISERWALVVINDGGDTLEFSPMLCCLLTALRNSCGGDEDAMSDSLVPIGGAGGCFSVLSIAGLLPAAVMGLDIVRLLQGAAMMNERFRAAPLGDNPALDCAGVSHVMETIYGANSGDLAPWPIALEPAARWYKELQFEWTNRDDAAAESGGLTHNLVVDAVRRDRLVVSTSEDDSEVGDDQLAEAFDASLPDLQSAVVQSAREAYALERRPSADLHLPSLDESAMGQFFQMMMLATSIDERLNGSVPDGQAAAERDNSK